MALLRDGGDQLLRSSVPFDDLHLEDIFDDNGVSGHLVYEMLALERDTFQRCLSAQPARTALQSFNRRKCALLLCGLAATADLPPHSAPFAQQLLDRTHRRWSEREDPDIDVNDAYHLAAAAYICVKLCSARYPDPAPFQLPDTREPARSLTDLLTALAALLARRQPHSAPLLHSSPTVHEVVAEEYRMLESVNFELEAYTPGDWVKLFDVRFFPRTQQHAQRASRARPSAVLESGALCIVSDYVGDSSFSLDSRPSHIGSSAWFLSCVLWVCLRGFTGVVLRWLGSVPSAHVLSHSPRFRVWWSRVLLL